MVSLNSMQTVQQNSRFNLKNQQNVNSRAKKNIKSQPNFGMKFVMPKAELEDFLHTASIQHSPCPLRRKNYEQLFSSIGDALKNVNEEANDNFAIYVASKIKKLRKSEHFDKAWNKVFGEPYKKTEGISDKITEKVVPGYKDIVVPIELERHENVASYNCEPRFIPSDEGTYARLATENNADFRIDSDYILHADVVDEAIKHGSEDVIECEAHVRSKDVVERLKNIIGIHNPPKEEKYNDIFI